MEVCEEEEELTEAEAEVAVSRALVVVMEDMVIAEATQAIHRKGNLLLSDSQTLPLASRQTLPLDNQTMDTVAVVDLIKQHFFVVQHYKRVTFTSCIVF